MLKLTISRGQLVKVINKGAAAMAGAYEARNELLAVGQRAPQRNEAQNLAQRFRRHGEAYFRFITTPGIEPTTGRNRPLGSW